MALLVLNASAGASERDFRVISQAFDAYAASSSWNQESFLRHSLSSQQKGLKLRASSACACGKARHTILDYDSVRTADLYVIGCAERNHAGGWPSPWRTPQGFLPRNSTCQNATLLFERRCERQFAASSTASNTPSRISASSESLEIEGREPTAKAMLLSLRQSVSNPEAGEIASDIASGTNIGGHDPDTPVATASIGDGVSNGRPAGQGWNSAGAQRRSHAFSVSHPLIHDHHPALRTLLGVDFGGTGIKGAPVDVIHGTLLQERIRIPTPSPATPEAVVAVIRELQERFKWHGPIGLGMPSVVRKGVVRTAANIDASWVNVMVQAMLETSTQASVGVLNDADAAGYAEILFGAGRAHQKDGVVLMLTFGTGIGTALFVDGKLVPNLEMGHIEVEGEVAEKVASGAVREREDMSWKKWASRVNAYLERMERYLQPDLIIIGGGVSKKDEKFMHLLVAPGGTTIVRAEMRNDAGIVGAAVGAAEILRHRWDLEAERDVDSAVLS